MRKNPKQKRSKEMVNRLLDATARTLIERGLDNTTTNHIAEQAGVSIGSLYQYFPDKDALVVALLERMSVDARKRFRSRAEGVDLHQLPLKQVAELAIAYGINYIVKDPLTMELVKNWNRVPIEKLLDPLVIFFLTMAQPYFLKNYANYPVEGLETKLYVLINSTLFTCIRFLMDENSLIKQEDIVATLAQMIVLLLEDNAAR